MNATDDTQAELGEQGVYENEVEVDSFGTVTIRKQKNISITDAAERAGVSPVGEGMDRAEDSISAHAAAARFITTGDNGSVALAIERNRNADGRRSDLLRPVKQAGSSPPQHTFRVTLPDDVLAQLDIDPSEAIGETLEVKAGDGLIIIGKPQSATITVVEPDDSDEALGSLGPKAADYFREVELKRRHPMVVAIEEGVTTQHAIHTVREARSRLRELVDQGYDVNYDFDNPNVPDSTGARNPIHIDADLPTTDMADGELRAAVYSNLTTHLSQQVDENITDMVEDTIGDSVDDVGEASDSVAEAYTDAATRDELADMYIRLVVAETATPGVGGGWV